MARGISAKIAPKIGETQKNKYYYLFDSQKTQN